jgi:hypothetical protein
MFLHFPFKTHIMQIEMQSTTNSRLQALTRWSVVLAVLAGIAAWMYVAPPGLTGKLDAIGYAVCHRLESHSLKTVSQMLLCVRCTGEFTQQRPAVLQAPGVRAQGRVEACWPCWQGCSWLLHSMDRTPT